MHHELHGSIGPIPLFFNLGLLLAVILWRGKQFYNIRLVSFIALILVFLILLRTISSLRNDHEGMIQRFYYLGWSLWSVALSLIFMKSYRQIGFYKDNTGKGKIPLSQ
jgi:hypothetical protein